jgi:hypothetical protein
MFIAKRNVFIQFAMDKPTMGALALCMGCRWRSNLVYIPIECDSLEVVQALLNPSEYRATGAVVIDDC